VVWKLEC